MEDFDKPAQSQGSIPSTEQTDRLLQRVEKPGVIDTRPAEQIHARTADWVSGRLDLLERFATRYGIVEAIPQVTTTLLRSGPGWPVESAGQVASADLPTVSPETWTATAPAASKILLSEKDELRHEGRPSDRGELKVRRPEGSTPKIESSVATSGAEGSVSRDASPPPQVKEIPGQASATPVSLHLRRNRANATPSQADSVARDSTNLIAAVSRDASSPPPQVKEIPGQASALPVRMHLRRNRSDETPSRAEGVVHDPISPIAATSLPEPVATAPDVPRVKVESVSPVTSASLPAAPESTRLPLVKEQKPSARSPILQRKQAAMPNPPPLATPGAVSSTGTDDASTKVVPGAVTAEMPMPPAIQRVADVLRTTQSTTATPLVARETYVARTSAQPVSLIFRNTDGRGPATRGDSPQNPLLLAGSTRSPAPPVLRETASTQYSGASELSVLGGSASEGGGGIDVAEVAEQVTRMLARQLAVDRERRGRVR